LTRPDLGERYPLQLLSPPRPQFVNSTFANSPRHRTAAGDPTIELADEDARARGLVDGDWVEVYNDRGRFQARVSLSGSVRPGVAVATGIYWNKLVPGGCNVNSTSSSALADMGGGATFFDNLVEVRPVTGLSSAPRGIRSGEERRPAQSSASAHDSAFPALAD
jgi:anaerobic selenocysteine-containing dehydrogenase